MSELKRLNEDKADEDTDGRKQQTFDPWNATLVDYIGPTTLIKGMMEFLDDINMIDVHGEVEIIRPQASIEDLPYRQKEAEAD